MAVGLVVEVGSQGLQQLTDSVHTAFKGQPSHPVVRDEGLVLLIIEAAEIFKKKKVQVGKDQEKAQSEKDSHSKNQGGKKPN